MEGTAKEPCARPWPDSLDAVVAAPGSHRVVLENETTRVLEVTIAPGEREPEHTHRWPSVMVVHRQARIRYYTGDTLTFTSPEQPSPAVPGPRVNWLDPEGPHSVENIDGHVYGAFRIELKAALTGSARGLNDQQVVGAAVDQEGGVVALGVQRVGGDHDAGEVQAGQQRLEGGHFTRRAVDLALGEHGAVMVVQRCQQVHLVAVTG